MYKVLNETNNDKEKNSKLVNIFDSGLEDLEKEIKEMSQKEIEIEKPYNIVKLVKKILDINKHSQEWQGIKILIPNQMFSRLPISLAQSKAGNNFNKLKNEIRQLLHSLYRSKNMTKQVHNNLMNYIWIKNNKKQKIRNKTTINENDNVNENDNDNDNVNKNDKWQSDSHSHSHFDFDYWYYSRYNNGDNFYEYRE